MVNHNLRLIAYSSAAIITLIVVWGLKTIPQMSEKNENILRESLEQEVVLLNSATRSAIKALRFSLLDLLKAEGHDRPTRAFQDSIFSAVSLFEVEGSEAKAQWVSVKPNLPFTIEKLKALSKLALAAKISGSDSFFAKALEHEGQPYYAIWLPVKKPGASQLLGFGLFPAAQFGLVISADRHREIKVFDDQGLALALSRPAYLGSSIRKMPWIDNFLSDTVAFERGEWINEKGVVTFGAAARVAESNLSVSVEAALQGSEHAQLKAWIYLVLSGLGALVLNWLLLNSIVSRLFKQLAVAEEFNEDLMRQLKQRVNLNSGLNDPELPHHTFLGDSEPSAEEPSVESTATKGSDSVVKTELEKVIKQVLRNQEQPIKEKNISVSVDVGQIAVEQDILQLETAIEEVVKNAIEAMADTDKKMLIIKAQRVSSPTNESQIQLSVKDTGVGIHEKHLGRIFDPFYSTKDSEGVARGLGLNVVRRVLDELKGSVNVKSETDSQAGTEVTLTWPTQTQSQTQDLQQPLNDDLNLQSSQHVSGKLNSMDAANKVVVRRPVVRTLD